MQQFSIHAENVVLCATEFSRAEVRSYTAGQQFGAEVAPPTEVVLCVVDGALSLVAGAEQIELGPMQGVQIPAGWAWSAVTGAAGAKLLWVDSFHPNFAPDRALLPALDRLHRFDVAHDQWLVYTDFVRGGVLTFAPGFVADKHFHQDADEIFWFFQGLCRVTTSEGATLVPAGEIVYTAPGEWHIIENAGDEPLLMFLTVTPNITPSHTFFLPDGTPHVRNWAPFRGPR